MKGLSSGKPLPLVLGGIAIQLLSFHKSSLSAYPVWAPRTQATCAALASKDSWYSEGSRLGRRDLFQRLNEVLHIKSFPVRAPVPLDGPGLRNGGKIHHCVMESTATF